MCGMQASELERARKWRKMTSGVGFPREARGQEALPTEPSLFLSAEQRILTALTPHLL